MKRRVFSTILILNIMLHAPVYSQTIPNSVSPEHLENQLRNNQPSFINPQFDIFPDLSPPQAPHKKDGSEAKFLLKSVKIDDSTAYPNGTFETLFSHDIGKEVTLSHLRDIVYGITQRYRKDGYIISQAIIPKQELENGELHIRVVEGFIDKVIIENDNPSRDRRNLIRQYSDKISKDHPLNIRTIERYMLLINDIPGVTAHALLKPSQTVGAADLLIDVTNKGVDTVVSSSNRGNKFIGPYQEQLAVNENSLAGLGESTTIRVINTIPEREMHYVDIQHEEQIGDDGTKLIFFASSIRTAPGNTLSPLMLRGNSDDFSTTITYPFIRSRTENLTTRAIFDVHDSENDSLGERLSNDRVRSSRLGINYTLNDQWDGFNTLDSAICQGMHLFGATDDGLGRTRSVGEQTFTKANMDISRVQNLPDNFSILAAATGQFSTQPLLLSEQFSLGGDSFGRAYDSGEISGDSGIGTKVELRYTQPVSQNWLDSYQLYSYYDVGKLYLNAVTAGVDNAFSLASTGAGIRTDFTNNINGNIEVDFPMTREVASEGNKKPRLFYMLSARF